eukprot:TRINITY_DN16632_c0_g1_i2.p1 TRINITY_DN16632_c0_g1~~TRINITY_DN16632_c0_g1_i2.p1  ORF type:complete len:331 (-),score=68.76 TRINITY_DN16632_c0_g1_i2:160-1029(-)
MVHQNTRLLNIIKAMFPVRAVIKSLRSADLDIVVKTGLTRVFTSLFMNSEKILSVKKPRTQRALGEYSVGNAREITYLSEEQLQEVKDIISTYFEENTGDEDLSLHYEFLRLLSYLLNSDFLLGPVNSKDDWREKLERSYKLLEKAFRFCVKQLSTSVDPKDKSLKKRTTTGNIMQVHDEMEDVPIIPSSKEVVTEKQLAEARTYSFKLLARYSKFILNYMFIFKTFVSGEKRKDLYQSYAKDITLLIQEEICNFMSQLVKFMYDGYITEFTNLIHSAKNGDPQEYCIK